MILAPIMISQKPHWNERFGVGLQIPCGYCRFQVCDSEKEWFEHIETQDRAAIELG